MKSTADRAPDTAVVVMSAEPLSPRLRRQCPRPIVTHGAPLVQRIARPVPKPQSAAPYNFAAELWRVLLAFSV